MRINQETDYALRVVLLLSRQGLHNRVGAKEIAEKKRIPLRFALKLLRKLNQSGITRSYRGADGGYAINRAPEDITIKDVIEAIEGPITINRCLTEEDAECNLYVDMDNCALHNALDSVQQLVLSKFDEINFKDLINR